MVQNKDYWLFVIDTDTYAGSFERELTGYCTGQIGECGIGSECAERFHEEHPEMVDVFEQLILHLPDEHGCYRPTSIYPTPGYWSDGLGTCWPDSKWGSQEAQEKYMLSMKKFKPTSSDPIGHCLAYMSVAIFFIEQPTPRIIHFLMQRVLSYTPVGSFSQTFTVTGFRIMHHVEADKLVKYL